MLNKMGKIPDLAIKRVDVEGEQIEKTKLTTTISLEKEGNKWLFNKEVADFVKIGIFQKNENGIAKVETLALPNMNAKKESYEIECDTEIDDIVQDYEISCRLEFDLEGLINKHSIDAKYGSFLKDYETGRTTSQKVYENGTIKTTKDILSLDDKNYNGNFVIDESSKTALTLSGREIDIVTVPDWTIHSKKDSDFDKKISLTNNTNEEKTFMIREQFDSSDGVEIVFDIDFKRLMEKSTLFPNLFEYDPGLLSKARILNIEVGRYRLDWLYTFNKVGVQTFVDKEHEIENVVETVASIGEMLLKPIPNKQTTDWLTFPSRLSVSSDSLREIPSSNRSLRRFVLRDSGVKDKNYGYYRYIAKITVEDPTYKQLNLYLIRLQEISVSYKNYINLISFYYDYELQEVKKDFVSKVSNEYLNEFYDMIEEFVQINNSLGRNLKTSVVFNLCAPFNATFESIQYLENKIDNLSGLISRLILSTPKIATRSTIVFRGVYNANRFGKERNISSLVVDSNIREMEVQSMPEDLVIIGKEDFINPFEKRTESFEATPDTSFEAKIPFLAPKVQVQVPQPKVQVQVPQTKVLTPQPKVQVQVPQTKVQVQVPQTKVLTPQPKVQVQVPQTKVLTPQPKVQVQVPQPKVTTPQTKVPTPQPKVQVQVPQPKVTTPQTKVPTPQPKVQVQVPQPKVTTPQTKVTTPQTKVLTPQPKVQVQVPQPKVTTPQTKMVVKTKKTNNPDLFIEVEPQTRISQDEQEEVAEMSIQIPQTRIPQDEHEEVAEMSIQIPQTRISQDEQEEVTEMSIQIPQTRIPQDEHEEVAEMSIQIPASAPTLTLQTEEDMTDFMDTIDAVDSIIASANKSKLFVKVAPQEKQKTRDTYAKKIVLTQKRIDKSSSQDLEQKLDFNLKIDFEREAKRNRAPSIKIG